MTGVGNTRIAPKGVSVVSLLHTAPVITAQRGFDRRIPLTASWTHGVWVTPSGRDQRPTDGFSGLFDWGRSNSSRSRGVFEKVIQMLDHKLLDVGVLIGELEHHSADEDLAAGVCFSFADGEARADATGSSVQLGFPCVQFGLQFFLFLFQFRQQFFICQSHGLKW